MSLKMYISTLKVSFTCLMFFLSIFQRSGSLCSTNQVDWKHLFILKKGTGISLKPRSKLVSEKSNAQLNVKWRWIFLLQDWLINKCPFHSFWRCTDENKLNEVVEFHKCQAFFHQIPSNDILREKKQKNLGLDYTKVLLISIVS